jgi:co-chaperonin GroES (HSP10)
MTNELILPNKLLLQEIPEKEVVKGSLILPNQIRKNNDTRKGKIIMRGKNVCEDLKEGMTVLYPRMSITKFELENEQGELKEVGLLGEASVLYAYQE